jgi:hypothetical protein
MDFWDFVERFRLGCSMSYLFGLVFALALVCAIAPAFSLAIALCRPQPSAHAPAPRENRIEAIAG